jgi:nitrite reductase (NADH) small subunit
MSIFREQAFGGNGKMSWTTICRSEELPADSIKRKRLPNGDPVAVARLKDERLVAFHNECPHFKGPLGVGALHDTEIVCPWHFFRFDLITGKAVGTAESIMKLKLYEVREENGEVAVACN